MLKILKKWRLLGDLWKLRQRLESLDKSIICWRRTMETHPEEARGEMWAGVLDSLLADRQGLAKIYIQKLGDLKAMEF